MIKRLNEKFFVAFGKIEMNEVYGLLPNLVICLGVDTDGLNLKNTGALVKYATFEELQDSDVAYKKFVEMAATSIFYGDRVLFICRDVTVPFVVYDVFSKFGFTVKDIDEMVYGKGKN